MWWRKFNKSNEFCHIFCAVNVLFLQKRYGPTNGWTDRRMDRRTNGRTDRRMDGPMDGPTDGPSYRDARTHLKIMIMSPTVYPHARNIPTSSPHSLSKQFSFFSFLFYPSSIFSFLKLCTLFFPIKSVLVSMPISTTITKLDISTSRISRVSSSLDLRMN